MKKKRLTGKKYIIISISITFFIILSSLFFDSLFPLPSEDQIMPSNVLLGDSAKRAVYRDSEISNGTITIIEFSDFQCPYCKESQNVLKRIKEAYRDKVQIIYRHFPTGHTFSETAAEAVECASDQGMFWEYHDKLFNNQITSKDNFFEYANSLGIDVNKFFDCLISHEKASFVEQDFNLGLSLGVQGTPTFIIGEKIIVGLPQYYEMKNIIDAQLEEDGHNG